MVSDTLPSLKVWFLTASRFSTLTRGVCEAMNRTGMIPLRNLRDLLPAAGCSGPLRCCMYMRWLL